MPFLNQESPQELYRQIISLSDDLSEHLSAKNWSSAIAIDKKRLSLLTRLGEIHHTIKTDEYTSFLNETLTFVQTKQSEVQQELDNCRAKMGELGQQRRASNLYQDTSLTR